MSVINIGAPAHDGFTSSVFNNSLQHAKTQKFAITSVYLAELRKQLKDFLTTVNGDRHSLDIVADAPQGEQWFGNSTVTPILDDPQTTLDDELVDLIKEHFYQCRLLGCVTAYDSEDHARMLNLARVLGMPVIGTLRAIAYTDFDERSFRDTQMVRGEEVSIVYSTSRMKTISHQVPRRRAKLLASGAIQEAWLRGFTQVTIRPEDLECVESMAPICPPYSDSNGDFQFELACAESMVPLCQMPDGFLNSPIAATDVIRTAPAGIVALQAGPLKLRAEVLASATLLRLRSVSHGAVYVNVPPRSSLRRDLLLLVPRRRLPDVRTQGR